ncbi:MAG: Sec-independent protein translocase protein TatB [Candidatus Nanopelagicales bacterium]
MGDNGRVMDVGWGELLLLGAVALLIFGPDKLPKAAADAGRMVRKLKELASTAQQDLTPDLDLEGIKADLRSVSDLHPKRIISSAMSDATTPTPKKATASAAPTVSAEASSGVPAAPVTPARAAGPRLDPDAT